MKVLIGYDGSDSSRDAILELHRAGLPPETNATVVSVADVWPRPPVEPPAEAAPSPASAAAAAAAASWQQSPIVRKARAVAERAVAEVQAMAAEGGALVKAEFPGWSVSHASYAGSPDEVLVSPDGGAFDLVVIGSQGRSALGRLVLGSVSQRVLMHAPCSVRVGRRPPADAAPRGGAVRIIVGIDGSRHSALAVSAVAGRVWPSATEVKVVAAVDLKLLSVLASPAPSPWARPWLDAAPSGDDARAWACQAVGAVAAELRATGVAATPVVEEADAKQLLLGEAERWPADCIFLGAKGHSAVERFLLGSVSASVAARASCSVEVVRQG